MVIKGDYEISDLEVLFHNLTSIEDAIENELDP